MNTGKIFATALCALLLGAIAATAFGQIAPAPDVTAAGAGEGPVAAVSDPSSDTGGGDLDFGQACGSRWTASAEFILLGRVGVAPYALVESVPHDVRYADLRKTAGTVVLNAADLDQGFAGGPRVGLTRRGDDGNDWELTFFQIDGWNNAKSIGPIMGADGHPDWLVMRAPGNFLQTQDTFFQLDQQVMEWGYASRLYNAELNRRWNLSPRVTLLAGFRWVNLSEDLDGILAPPGTDGAGTFWDTRTQNNLFGLQIGGDARLLERGRFSIGGLLKAGIFDNHADESTTVRMERTQFGESAKTDYPAFLGEIGLQCTYRPTRHLLLKAGYEAIWLQNVAQAPGQITEAYCRGADLVRDTSVQALGINCTSGVLFHGATAGLEYAF
jgi:hypothetical protein